MIDSQNSSGNSRGFTLIEMMVTIAVIALLSGILFSAMHQNQNAPRLETAQMVLSQAFANARSQAILKQNRARLIVNSTEPSNEKDAEAFLRYFGVIVETAPDSNQWETGLKGEFLPEDVFFIPDSASQIIEWNEDRPDSDYNRQTMTLNFPTNRAETPGSGPFWIFYEFKSTGRMSGLNNKVVLAEGSTQALKPTFDSTSAILGMVFNGYGLQFPLDEENAL